VTKQLKPAEKMKSVHERIISEDVAPSGLQDYKRKTPSASAGELTGNTSSQDKRARTDNLLSMEPPETLDNVVEEQAQEVQEGQLPLLATIQREVLELVLDDDLF
jgi:hypothetical protein